MALQILANENVPGDAVEALRKKGHDLAWVREDAPGTADPQVLERAQKEGRILVTLDKDFGELAFLGDYQLPVAWSSSGLRCGTRPRRPHCWSQRSNPGPTGRDISRSSRRTAFA